MDRHGRTGATPKILYDPTVKECPVCASAMAFIDRHPCCIGCLGPDHALQALVDSSSCAVCAEMDLSRLQSRYQKARRGLQREGNILDPVAGRRAAGSVPRHGGHSRTSAARGAVTCAAFHTHTQQQGLSSDEASGASSRRSSALSSNPFVNPEPPAEVDDELPSYQSSSADVHMTSPRQAPDPAGPTGSRSSWDDAPDDDAPSAARRVLLSQDVLSSLLYSSSESGSQTVPDLDPVLAVFKAAAERCDVTWPTTAPPAAQQTDGPDDWPGIPPAPPVVPHERSFPVARGLRNAVHGPWERHVPPPRLHWLRGIHDAETLGWRRLPQMDPTLAAAFAELHRLQSAKGTAAKTPAAAKAVDYTKHNPFTDKASIDASKETRALYDTVGLLLRDVNALSMLLSSLAIKHGDVEDEDADIPEDLRVLGFCNLLCKHLAGWVGHIFDRLVLQERRRWLAPFMPDSSPGKPKPKNDTAAVLPWPERLLALPTSTKSLFEGGEEILLKVVAEKKAQQELTMTLSSAPDNLHPPPKKQPDFRGRQEFKAPPQPRRPSASPAPPGAQGHQVFGRGAGLLPTPNQPRNRSQSRGRGPKQGK